MINSDPAYILALDFTRDVREQLTALRARYFPAERNFLEAHVTLFHALPEAERARWLLDLETTCASINSFPIQFARPYSLGRGFAIRVEGEPLLKLRDRLQASWRAFLTPQDRQPYRPHCTLQNKVEPARAREALAQVQLTWQPVEAVATGCTLWRYEGGPWGHVRDLKFKLSLEP